MVSTYVMVIKMIITDYESIMYHAIRNKEAIWNVPRIDNKNIPQFKWTFFYFLRNFLMLEFIFDKSSVKNRYQHNTKNSYTIIDNYRIMKNPSYNSKLYSGDSKNIES